MKTDPKIEEHRKKHELLHKHLDELVADYILQTGKLPSKNTIFDLMEWSFTQSKNPSTTTI